MRKKKSSVKVDEGFLNGCAGKVQHRSYLSAKYFLETSHGNTNAKIYKCKYCGWFHLGTSKDQPKIKIKINKDGENQHKRKHKRFKY